MLIKNCEKERIYRNPKTCRPAIMALGANPLESPLSAAFPDTASRLQLSLELAGLKNLPVFFAGSDSASSLVRFIDSLWLTLAGGSANSYTHEF
jgi:hypothetical protein